MKALWTLLLLCVLAEYAIAIGAFVTLSWPGAPVGALALGFGVVLTFGLADLYRYCWHGDLD